MSYVCFIHGGELKITPRLEWGLYKPNPSFACYMASWFICLQSFQVRDNSCTVFVMTDILGWHFSFCRFSITECWHHGCENEASLILWGWPLLGDNSLWFSSFCRSHEDTLMTFVLVCFFQGVLNCKQPLRTEIGSPSRVEG